MSEQLANFQAMHEAVSAQLPSAQQPVARAAWQQFASFNFPKGRHEAWKYTNVRPLFTTKYALQEDAESAVGERRLQPISADAITISFVDGQLLSGAEEKLATAGIIFAPLQQYQPNCSNVSRPLRLLHLVTSHHLLISIRLWLKNNIVFLFRQQMSISRCCTCNFMRALTHSSVTKRRIC